MKHSEKTPRTMRLAAATVAAFVALALLPAVALAEEARLEVADPSIVGAMRLDSEVIRDLAELDLDGDDSQLGDQPGDENEPEEQHEPQCECPECNGGEGPAQDSFPDGGGDEMVPGAPEFPDGGGDEMVPADAGDEGDDSSTAQEPDEPTETPEPEEPKKTTRTKLPYTGGNTTAFVIVGLMLAAMGTTMLIPNRRQDR